jgi:antitoxin HigA-1
MLRSLITIEVVMSKNRIAPVHPGVYLKELLDELGISQQRLAKALGVPPMRISHIVNGRRPVTAEMALRLSLYYRQSPQYWLNLQSRYDLDTTSDALAERLKHEITPLQAVA